MATLRQVLEDLGRLGKSPVLAAQARYIAARWLQHEAKEQGNAEQTGQFDAGAKALHARALQDIEAAVTAEVDVYVGFGTHHGRITDAMAEHIRTERAQGQRDRVSQLSKRARDEAEQGGHDAASLLEWAENRNIAPLNHRVMVDSNARTAVERLADLRFTWHAGSAAGFPRGEPDAITAAEERVDVFLLRQADSAVNGYLALESLRHLDGRRAAARGMSTGAPGLPGNPGAGRAGPPSAEVRTAKEPRGAAHEADKSAEL
ncbi:hypothetical protein ACPA54_23725 [Uniformispora flossi]|uniref:hypothetical protein n=1 Tax=Uniformispora flossi TaxID=3390723 RepID=UPI003C2B45E9